MDKSLEQTIKRIKRFGLTCTLNDNGIMRHFHNGHEYVEIGNIKWATCNVGAEKPTDSGLYFAWGETRGFTAKQVKNGEKRFDWDNYKYGTYDNLTKYNDADKKIVLEPLDNATINMGIGWRIPTKEEFKTLFDSTTSKWVTDYQGNGVNGRLFIDKKDNTKTLFFPAVGICSNGRVTVIGSCGFYWSSSLYSSNVRDALHFYFNYGGTLWDSLFRRCHGFPVRGVVG